MKKQVIHSLISTIILILLVGFAGLALFLSPQTVSANATTGEVQAPLAETAPPYDTAWGTSGSGEGQFTNPFGITVQGISYVFSADAGNHRVQRTDTSGGSKFIFGTGLCSGGPTDTLDCMSSPSGVAVDGSGNLYVVNRGNNKLQKFNSSGSIVWVSGDEAGEPTFNSPYGVAVNSAGTIIYVADTSAKYIRKLDSSGLQTLEIGINNPSCSDPTPPNGCLSNPRGVAADASGNIYVADTGNNQIQKFDAAGNALAKWGKADRTAGSNDGEFSSPSGIFIDSSGNIYIADTGNNRIQKWNSAITTKAWELTAGTGAFVSPTGVAVNTDGKVFVMNGASLFVNKFSQSSGGGTASSPATPTLVSPAGNLYLTSSMMTSYIWNRISGATEYDLYISGGQPFTGYDFYSLTANAVGCAGTESTCSVTPAATLTTGSWNWWVRARKTPTGESNWSDPAAFVARPPLPSATTLTAPIGGVTTSQTPTFSWQYVSGATGYQLWVRQDTNSQVMINLPFSSAAVGCTSPGSTCTLNSPYSLGNGQHTWKVQSTNSAGYTDSSSAVFNVIAPPVAPSQISPIGEVATQFPTYVWRRVDNATSYRLWITGASSSAPYILNTYSSIEAGCPGSETNCSVPSTTSMKLNAGSYTWNVQGVNSLNIYGIWSTGMSFRVLDPAPPATTLRSPIGGVTDKQKQIPTFTWDRVPEATWYRLVVGSNYSTSTNTITNPTVSKWVSVTDAGCGSYGPCVSTSGNTVGAGVRNWMVDTWFAGRSTASATATFFGLLPPDSPSPSLPSAGQVVRLANLQATYKFNGKAGAVAYEINVTNTTPESVIYYASDICNISLVCTVDPTLVPGSQVLSIGYHTWKVRGINELGEAGSWSNALEFYADITLPTAPTGLLVSPLNLVGDTTSRPTYQWNVVTGADTYRLYVVQSTDTLVISDNTYSNASANCGTTICSVSPDRTLLPTTHTWNITSGNSAGTAKSANGTFYPIQQWGDTPTAVYPVGEVNLSTAGIVQVFQWNRVQGATKYDLGLRSHDGSYTWTSSTQYSNLQVGCTTIERLCSLNPALDPSPPYLQEGTYYWWVRAYLNDTAGPSSAELAFTARPPKPPAATGLTVIPPAGYPAYVTSLTPRFMWDDNSTTAIGVTGASWYRVDVRSNSATGTVAFTNWWTSAMTDCNNTNCSRQISTNLVPGNYFWTVSSWNTGGLTPTVYSTFTAITAIDQNPVTISPKGDYTLNNLGQATFSWYKVVGAIQYELWVNLSGVKLFNSPITAADAGCNSPTSTICSYTWPAALAQGSYQWWIRAYDTAYRPWSTPATAFTAKEPPPSIPVLISPISSTPDPTTLPTYTWDPGSTPTAAWYQLVVRKGTPTGAAVFSRWYKIGNADITCGITCSVSPTTVLTPGTHYWTVLAWNSGGETLSNQGSFWVIQRLGEIPTLVSPLSNTVVGIAGHLPFTWNRIAGATGYVVYATYNGTVLNPLSTTILTPSEVGCAETTIPTPKTCTLPVGHGLNPEMASGSYKWWVQARGPGSIPWSSEAVFAPLPGPTNLLSPSNGSTWPGTPGWPTFTWERTASAEWYQLKVYDVTGTLLEVGKWVTPIQAGCSTTGSTCLYQTSTYIPSGTHQWKIQTWNSVPISTEVFSSTWTLIIP